MDRRTEQSRGCQFTLLKGLEEFVRTYAVTLSGNGWILGGAVIWVSCQSRSHVEVLSTVSDQLWDSKTRRLDERHVGGRCVWQLCYEIGWY